MNIRLHVPQRRRTDAPVQHAVLIVDGRSLVIDERNLPPRLVRLLPPAYASANHPDRNPGAWTQFIEMARALGYLPIAERRRNTAEYHPDCPSCLRGRPHTQSEHDAALRRVYASSRA